MQSRKIPIGILGDFDPARPSHLATNSALAHAATALPIALEPVWLPTKGLENPAALGKLTYFAGLWGAPGEHESSVGMLNGIRLARERKIPYLGT